MLRDVYGNMAVSNIFTLQHSVASSGGSYSMNVGSAQNQILTGTSSHSFVLPDATTLTFYTANINYYFNNNSTGNLLLKDNTGTLIYTFPAGSYVRVTCLDTSTAAGVW